MGVTASTAEEISVGAGEVYYQDGAGLWVPVGATKDNNVFRVNTDYAEIDLNGVVGPIKGIDYIQNQVAELEVSVAQLGADKLALMVPGVRTTVETAEDAGGGATTTLSAATEVGQWLLIPLTSIVGVSVGDTIRIGDTGELEFRTVTRSGSGTIDVDFPLQLAHASGDAVQETDGTGMTIITPPLARRLSNDVYRNWRLDVPGADGRMVRFHILNGIMTDNAEFEAADDDAMGPRLVIQGRIDAGAAALGSWRIERVPSYAELAGS